MKNMKTIGMIGGMSWESTVSYYQWINRGIKEALGGLHSAKLLLYSVDFDEIEKLQHQGDWQKTAELLAKAAQAVESGGADFLIICTNTMHKVADEVSNAVSIPLLHIGDATAACLHRDNIKKVGLLGTRFTMEHDFYRGRLNNMHGINVVIPAESDRQLVHDIIYKELCRGAILDSSRQVYLDIIAKLHRDGAEAIILGCTEIALLIKQQDTPVRLYDTTQIHAEYAVRMAIG